MDAKDARRIDSLYRNMKQLPLLAVLGLFVPFLLLFVFPLALAYGYLRTRLLKALEAGEIRIDPEVDTRSPRPGELSTAQKIDYIRYRNLRLWIPIVVGFCFLILGVIAVAIIIAQ